MLELRSSRRQGRSIVPTPPYMLVSEMRIEKLVCEPFAPPSQVHHLNVQDKP
jgi:hypothetical protein